MTSESAVWTVGQVLDWTARRFAELGFGSPRLDAELLLASVLGCDRVGLYVDYHKPLTGDEREAYRKRVRRRQAGEPVAYITGSKEFWSLSFAVDSRVLVPRPETELLVELALDLIREIPEPSVLDVGTGCGAVAVALAKERADARVVATDIDEAVLELARKNAEQNGVSVEFLKGPFFDPVSSTGKFHLVVSNPPYVATSSLGDVDPDVLKFEPRSALLAGRDGLDVIRELLTRAPGALRPGGWILLEMDPRQEDALRRLSEEPALWAEVRVRPDLARRARAFAARLA